MPFGGPSINSSSFALVLGFDWLQRYISTLYFCLGHHFLKTLHHENNLYRFHPRSRKHLDLNNQNASVFVNRHMIYQCIEQCVNNPDPITKCGKRFELTKTFGYHIGLSKCHRSMTNTVRVVYTKTKRMAFVVTAYPIEN